MCDCEFCRTFVAPAAAEPPTCGHVCCGRRTDPFHMHELPPERCASCAGDRALAADHDLADRFGDDR